MSEGGASASDASDASAPRRPPTLLTPRFGLVVLVGLLYFLSLGVVLPVVPQFIEGDLRGSDLAVGIGVGAFAVGAVALRPFAGRLGDRAGRRILIVGGAALVAVSTGAYHLVDGMVSLVAVRVFGGVGEAAFFVGAAAMVTDLAPEARRGEAISYWSVAVYGGLGFGPTLGEMVLDARGYAAVWTLGAVLATAAAVLGLATRETARLGGPPPATRPPLLHRAALAPGLILFLGLIALAGFVAFVPLYAPDVGLGDARGIFLAYGVVVLAVRIFGARIPDRIGPVRAATGATIGVAAGVVVLAAFPTVAGVYLGTVLFSLGMSLMYPAMLMLSLEGVPDTERSSAVGTVSTFFDLSQGVGAATLGLVADLAGIRAAFLTSGALALVGLAVLRTRYTPRPPGARGVFESRPQPVA